MERQSERRAATAKRMMMMMMMMITAFGATNVPAANNKWN